MNHEFIASHNGDAGRSNLAKARGTALRLLALRPRTVAEMKQRLTGRFDAATAEQAVTRLEAEGLLNDEAYARQWRESRERRRPRSARMIAAELRHKGVPAETIAGALEDFDSQAAAYRAAAKYASRQAGKDRTTFDRRVGAFLDRRGFQPSLIHDTVRQLREELGIGEAVYLEED